MGRLNRVYFIDRDLGYRIFPDALEEAGLTVIKHDDCFPHDTPDTEWFRRVAKEGWVGVSGDQKILRQPLAIAAIRDSVACVLVVVGTHVPAQERARNFVNTLPKIERLLEAMEPPAIAKIYRPTPRELVFEGKPGSVKQIPLPPSPNPHVTSGS